MNDSYEFFVVAGLTLGLALYLSMKTKQNKQEQPLHNVSPNQTMSAPASTQVVYNVPPPTDEAPTGTPTITYTQEKPQPFPGKVELKDQVKVQELLKNNGIAFIYYSERNRGWEFSEPHIWGQQAHLYSLFQHFYWSEEQGNLFDRVTGLQIDRKDPKIRKLLVTGSL
jgi:hypothetical protein